MDMAVRLMYSRKKRFLRQGTGDTIPQNFIFASIFYKDYFNKSVLEFGT